MHLLATQTGVIGGEAEAVDLGQAPGDVIIISAADSELALLARAHDALPDPKPSLRLANLMALGHNLSVDTWIENTARHAKIIIARILGGRPYWTYGVDRLTALARQNNIRLALLPGGADPDLDLTELSSLPPADCERIRQYLSGGGHENAENLLRFLDDKTTAAPPASLPKAGIYHKAAKKGVLHKNTAARKISRLSRAVNSATAV